MEVSSWPSCLEDAKIHLTLETLERGCPQASGKSNGNITRGDPWQPLFIGESDGGLFSESYSRNCRASSEKLKHSRKCDIYRKINNISVQLLSLGNRIKYWGVTATL